MDGASPGAENRVPRNGAGRTLNIDKGSSTHHTSWDSETVESLNKKVDVTEVHCNRTRSPIRPLAARRATSNNLGVNQPQAPARTHNIPPSSHPKSVLYPAETNYLRKHYKNAKSTRRHSTSPQRISPDKTSGSLNRSVQRHVDWLGKQSPNKLGSQVQLSGILDHMERESERSLALSSERMSSPTTVKPTIGGSSEVTAIRRVDFNVEVDLRPDIANANYSNESFEQYRHREPIHQVNVNIPVDLRSHEENTRHAHEDVLEAIHKNTEYLRSHAKLTPPVLKSAEAMPDPYPATSANDQFEQWKPLDSNVKMQSAVEEDAAGYAIPGLVPRNLCDPFNANSSPALNRSAHSLSTSGTFATPTNSNDRHSPDEMFFTPMTQLKPNQSISSSSMQNVNESGTPSRRSFFGLDKRRNTYVDRTCEETLLNVSLPGQVFDDVTDAQVVAAVEARTELLEREAKWAERQTDAALDKISHSIDGLDAEWKSPQKKMVDMVPEFTEYRQSLPTTTVPSTSPNIGSLGTRMSLPAQTGVQHWENSASKIRPNESHRLSFIDEDDPSYIPDHEPSELSIGDERAVKENNSNSEGLPEKSSENATSTHMESIPSLKNQGEDVSQARVLGSTLSAQLQFAEFVDGVNGHLDNVSRLSTVVTERVAAGSELECTMESSMDAESSQQLGTTPVSTTPNCMDNSSHKPQANESDDLWNDFGFMNQSLPAALKKDFVVGEDQSAPDISSVMREEVVDDALEEPGEGPTPTLPIFADVENSEVITGERVAVDERIEPVAPVSQMGITKRAVSISAENNGTVDVEVPLPGASATVDVVSDNGRLDRILSSIVLVSPSESGDLIIDDTVFEEPANVSCAGGIPSAVDDASGKTISAPTGIVDEDLQASLLEAEIEEELSMNQSRADRQANVSIADALLNKYIEELNNHQQWETIRARVLIQLATDSRVKSDLLREIADIRNSCELDKIKVAQQRVTMNEAEFKRMVARQILLIREKIGNVSDHLQGAYDNLSRSRNQLQKHVAPSSITELPPAVVAETQGVSSSSVEKSFGIDASGNIVIPVVSTDEPRNVIDSVSTDEPTFAPEPIPTDDKVESGATAAVDIWDTVNLDINPAAGLMRTGERSIATKDSGVDDDFWNNVNLDTHLSLVDDLGEPAADDSNSSDNDGVLNTAIHIDRSVGVEEAVEYMMNSSIIGVETVDPLIQSTTALEEQSPHIATEIVPTGSDDNSNAEAILPVSTQVPSPTALLEDVGADGDISRECDDGERVEQQQNELEEREQAEEEQRLNDFAAQIVETSSESGDEDEKDDISLPDDTTQNDCKSADASKIVMSDSATEDDSTLSCLMRNLTIKEDTVVPPAVTAESNTIDFESDQPLDALDAAEPELSDQPLDALDAAEPELSDVTVVDEVEADYTHGAHSISADAKSDIGQKIDPSGAVESPTKAAEDLAAEPQTMPVEDPFAATQSILGGELATAATEKKLSSSSDECETSVNFDDTWSVPDSVKNHKPLASPETVQKIIEEDLKREMITSESNAIELETSDQSLDVVDDEDHELSDVTVVDDAQDDHTQSVNSNSAVGDDQLRHVCEASLSDRAIAGNDDSLLEENTIADDQKPSSTQRYTLNDSLNSSMERSFSEKYTTTFPKSPRALVSPRNSMDDLPTPRARLDSSFNSDVVHKIESNSSGAIESQTTAEEEHMPQAVADEDDISIAHNILLAEAETAASSVFDECETSVDFDDTWSVPDSVKNRKPLVSQETLEKNMKEDQRFRDLKQEMTTDQWNVGVVAEMCEKVWSERQRNGFVRSRNIVEDYEDLINLAGSRPDEQFSIKDNNDLVQCKRARVLYQVIRIAVDIWPLPSIDSSRTLPHVSQYLRHTAPANVTLDQFKTECYEVIVEQRETHTQKWLKKKCPTSGNWSDSKLAAFLTIAEEHRDIYKKDIKEVVGKVVANIPSDVTDIEELAYIVQSTTEAMMDRTTGDLSTSMRQCLNRSSLAGGNVSGTSADLQRFSLASASRDSLNGSRLSNGSNRGPVLVLENITEHLKEVDDSAAM